MSGAGPPASTQSVVETRSVLRRGDLASRAANRGPALNPNGADWRGMVRRIRVRFLLLPAEAGPGGVEVRIVTLQV